MALSAMLAAGVFVGLLVLMGAWLTVSLTDVVLVCTLSFGLFYGFRAVLLAYGLDTPSPDEFFSPTGYRDTLTTTLIGTSVFFAMLLVGLVGVLRSGAPGFAPFFVVREPDPGRLTRAALLVTAGAVGISTLLVAKYGSPAALMAAAKQDKALAGMYVLRVVPAVGSILAGAAFLDLRRRPGWRPKSWVALVCTAVNGFAVFLWGSRSLLVVSAAFVVLGVTQLPRRGGRRSAGRAVVAVVVAAIVVIGAAGALRATRDTLTHGEVASTYESDNPWRQASIGTNSVYLDAAMLSFRDFPDRYAYRGGQDFVNGVAGLVPRSVWKQKPTGIAPGSWFRQLYQPGIINGWPMGAPALWYLNFGWWGLPVGGLLSGLAIGLVAARQRRVPLCGFNAGAAVVTGVFVLGLGWDSQTLVNCVIWLVPLWLLARYVEGDPPETEASVDAPPAAVAVP